MNFRDLVTSKLIYQCLQNVLGYINKWVVNISGIWSYREKCSKCSLLGQQWKEVKRKVLHVLQMKLKKNKTIKHSFIALSEKTIYASLCICLQNRRRKYNGSCKKTYRVRKKVFVCLSTVRKTMKEVCDHQKRENLNIITL